MKSSRPRYHHLEPHTNQISGNDIVTYFEMWILSVILIDTRHF